MGKLFGTDGVRGVAGKDLTCELALQIGRATAAELTSLDGHRPRILIGKDTRVSGDMLECTLAAGLCSVGADVDLLGVIPTPGVAYLVRKYGADAGIVISASHNPMEFNGIKIFKGDGYKLPDEVENRIEAHIFKNCEDIKICDGAEIGRVHRLDTAVDDYVDALEQHIDADLSGLNVLFDCANGASAKVAQKLFPAWAASAALPVRWMTAFPSTMAAAPPTWTGWKRRSWKAALTAALPLTAMQTAAWPAMKRAQRSTATRSLRWLPRI